MLPTVSNIPHPRHCMQNRPLFSLTFALCTAVWTSYLYYSKPRYLTAFLVNLAAAAMAIVMVTITRIYLRKQNAKLEKGLAGADRLWHSKLLGFSICL